MYHHNPQHACSNCYIVSTGMIPPQGEWRRAANQKTLHMLLFKGFLTERIGPEEEVIPGDTDDRYILKE